MAGVAQVSSHRHIVYFGVIARCNVLSQSVSVSIHDPYKRLTHQCGSDSSPWAVGAPRVLSSILGPVLSESHSCHSRNVSVDSIGQVFRAPVEQNEVPRGSACVLGASHKQRTDNAENA